MPGYNIVGINSNSIIPSLGAIHCIVKEVGVSDPVWISHARVDSIVYDEDSIAVSALIKTESGIADAYVYWTTDTTAGFNPVIMQFINSDTAVGYIPPQLSGTEIFYYVSATSNSGRTVAKPLVAPDGFYKFSVINSVTGNNERNYAEQFYLSQNYPNPFNPSTKIKFTIPSNVKRKMSNVLLKVYDILGNEVVTLVSDELPAGEYKVEFNASELTSGVYFYQLTVTDVSLNPGQMIVKTKKMILLR
jgi:hypothetical protein